MLIPKEGLPPGQIAKASFTNEITCRTIQENVTDEEACDFLKVMINMNGGFDLDLGHYRMDLLTEEDVLIYTSEVFVQ